MSRRRRTWTPHTPATPDELLDQQFGRQFRRVKHLTVIPPRSPAEVRAGWAAEEAEWDAEDRQEQAVTRLLLGAVGMFCLGVVLMSLWPLALATFRGAP